MSDKRRTLPDLGWLPVDDPSPQIHRRMRAEAGRYQVSGFDLGPLLPPVAPLSLSFIVTLDDVADGQTIQLVGHAWAALLAEIAKDPEALQRLTPRQLEELVAATYDAAGFDEVILTPRSGDLGRDVIAIRKGLGSVRLLDQVKHLAPGYRVTADDVRAVCGVLSHDLNATKAVLTTTAEFAPGIHLEFSDMIPCRLELYDGLQLRERLARLGESYEKKARY